jgi:hypothetical protein
MGKLDKAAGGIKSPEAAQRSPTQTSEERRYRTEENLRTVQNYTKIANDPHALRDVQALAHEQMERLAEVANHAKGATTRGAGKGPSTGHAGATKSSPPKAASKGGSTGGGARNMGRASKTSSKTYS